MLEWALPAAVVSGAVVETFVQPRAAMGLRATRLIVSGCFAGALTLILLALSARPVCSVVAAVVLMITVVAVSNAKFSALKEPLVFVDFAMLEQVVRHPQLFLPYLGVIPAAVIIGSIVLGIGAAVRLETPVRLLPGDRPMWLLLLIVCASAVLVARVGPLRSCLTGWGWRLEPSLDPPADIRRFGLFGTLLLTSFLFGDRTGKDAVRQRKRRTLAPPPSGVLPDIVAVQAESFFDVRRMDRRIDRGALPCFDACAAEAVFRGRLEVPAWGGYTQRTEFAFLTGLPGAELGLDRFNPYLRFARRPVWSIAHELRELGYRTICIHPFPGSFFGRDRVLPNLGFDVFLDIAAFQEARRFGPYVSDLSVAEKIIEVLRLPGGPKFVFAITMENHGQWRKDRLPPEAIARTRALAPEFPSEFLCYLRHLESADAMIGRLTESLRAQGDGLLCVFGDHLPSFPKLFDRSGFTDPRSDYVIWRPHRTGAASAKDVSVLDLSDLLLSAAGIRSAPSAVVELRSGRRASEVWHPAGLRPRAPVPPGP